MPQPLQNTLNNGADRAGVICAVRVGSHRFPFLAQFIPLPTSEGASPSGAGVDQFIHNGAK
jgi:hypothetical protein